MRWQDGVADADAAWTRAEMQRACERYTDIFGTPPLVHGAAGWQMNVHALRLTQRLGFEYCSDGRGTHPHLPVWNGELIRCPQLPTTLPTMDELIGRDGITEDNVAAHLLERTREPPPAGHVFTLHAELEGMRLAPAFEQLLVGLEGAGLEARVDAHALRDAAAAGAAALRSRPGHRRRALRHAAASRAPNSWPTSISRRPRDVAIATHSTEDNHARQESPRFLGARDRRRDVPAVRPQGPPGRPLFLPEGQHARAARSRARISAISTSSSSKLGAVVAGVSRDTLKSHEGFKAKMGFPFELLSDADEKLCAQFDVIKMKNMYGKKVRGIERSTFLIGPDGKLVREWRKVKVDGHAAEVLEAVKASEALVRARRAFALLVALCAWHAAAGQAVDQPAKKEIGPPKPKVYALIAAVGGEFSIVHEVQTTGTHLAPYRRTASAVTSDHGSITLDSAVSTRRERR